VPVKILLFNNRIYGLTKGQASPTSELGKVTKSTPFGASDAPFDPIALALGAGATFVARTLDTDKQHLPAMLRAAVAHPGAALIEVLQNCPVFNDGAFDALTDKQTRPANVIELEHGEPIRFGLGREHGVARGEDGDLRIVEVAAVGEDALVRHDAHRADPSLAFALSRLGELDGGATPIGTFRAVARESTFSALSSELATAHAGFGPEELATLLHQSDTWTVGV
jgi:2-oxoglutarate ferredoxin oxidoreductase subunit beta